MAEHLAQQVDRRVIVVLKDQHPNLPATPADATTRTQVVTQDQVPVLNDLAKSGAQGVLALKLVNDVVATVSPDEANRLAADPAVAKVVPDVSVSLRPPRTLADVAPGVPDLPGTHASPPSRGQPGQSPQSAPPPAGNEATCDAGPDGVELDPEALSVIHADGTKPGEPTAAGLGFTGKGVSVAYIAEGIDVNDPGFIRSNGQHVFVDYKDFTGEGATTSSSGGEAILDASSVAAQGNQVFQHGSCKLRVRGVAPGASLVGLKVFPMGKLAATTSALLQAIDYAVTVDHVDVLNQSFGYNPLPDTAADLIRQADEQAVAAGTTIVVSSGDAGPTHTIGSPATDPGVITAGASTTFRVYAQDDLAHYDQIGAKGWVDNNMSALSSSGLAEDLKSPDLVAPGDLNRVLSNPKPNLFGTTISGGTSEAAPLTSATAALVIQAFRQAHGGASPSPALVEKIITSTADDLGHPGYEQGAGLLDSYRAVTAALSIGTPGRSSPRVGQGLVLSADQLDATAAPSTAEQFDLRMTNAGRGTQTVDLHGRVLGPYRSVATKQVVLGDTIGEHFQGRNVQKVTFSVPEGASRLEADIAAPANDSSLDLTLLDPLGQLDAYSLPQGHGNHDRVEVRNPAFGTWTAIITDLAPAKGGYTGPVAFQASVANYQPFGQVQPGRVSLRPGQSRTVRVRVTTPPTPGDLSAAVEVDQPFAKGTSVAVNLRSLVPLGHGPGQFRADVTGGNGRGGAPGAINFYQFDVPAGQPALDVKTSLAGALDSYDLYLVDPAGEAVGHASNQLVVGRSGPKPTTMTERGSRVHVLSPAAGRWTLVVEVPNPVAGTQLTSSISGAVSFATIDARATGVPGSPSVHLVAGHHHVAAVTVRNDGTAPETYFVDGRLDRTTTLALPSYTRATGLTLPLTTSVPTPQWIVPTETTGLIAQAEASAPVTFDFAPYTGYLGGDLNGDPDLGATTFGDTAVGTWHDNPVTPGDWEIDPALIGPFGAQAAPPATANLALLATTKAFDPTVTSTTGDFWATEAGQAGSFTPVIVGPGQTTTIYVVITPTAPTGSVVNGTLYLDDASSLSPFGQAVPSGDELLAIPYTYTVAQPQGPPQAGPTSTTSPPA